MKLAGVIIVSEAEVIGRNNLENLSRDPVEFFLTRKTMYIGLQFIWGSI